MNKKELGFKEIPHNEFEKIGKKYKIFAELLDDGTISQFKDVLSQDYVTYAALMPDTHAGYSMPIGGVCSTKGKIVPQFVGFDIGCGMCAYKTDFKKDEVSDSAELIYEEVRKRIPLGFSVHSRNQKLELDINNLSDVAKKALNEVGLKQVGTLGGGNHFIEIGYDENEDVWVVIHSGSRGFGHKIASHYMMKAYMNFLEKDSPIEKALEEFKEEFKIRKAEVLKHNPKGYEASLEKALKKERAKLEKKYAKIDLDKIQGIYALDIDSKDGKDYIDDLNFALDFALENRKRMITEVNNAMSAILNKETIIDYDNEERFINRNHNHAEFNETLGEWIHRKGATHAEKGMRGVIPGNMRDGSFVVVGKGNPDSLFSSSHGAGRVMSRKKAKELVSLDDFAKSMNGICGTVDENTIDESPFAYKDIFEVMELQKDLVDIEYHIKPIINIKDNTKNRY